MMNRAATKKGSRAKNAALALSLALCSARNPTALNSRPVGPTKGAIAKPKAIVVGGGPVGLAAALALCNFHSYDVTVYESTPYEEFRSFDPTKAFLYLISGRGQDFTKKFPELQRKLIDRGVSSSSPFVNVPADIEEPVPDSGFSLLRRGADFGKEDDDEEEGREDGGSKPYKGQTKDVTGYWIPRHEMTNILYETIRSQEIQNGKNENPNRGTITCKFGSACQDVRVSEDEKSITVLTKDMRGDEHAETAKLVVAGDGNNSRVRHCLSTNTCFDALDPRFDPKRFEIKRWVSPSTDLRLKALQLPPRFPIPQADAEPHVTSGQCSYAIGGKNTGPRSYVRLGCLPMNDDEVVRPANVITRPDHDLWKLTEGEDARKWMHENFPRMPFQPEAEGGIVSDSEWERFAKARGLSFPTCQYSPGLVVASSVEGVGEGEEGGDCGVVLIGDAAHSFPPDIGQGINAGLSDVVELDKKLRNDGEAISLSKALKSYEKIRVPETKALIRLARFGFPFQYRQPHYVDRFRRTLCLVNFAIRMLLHKLTAGFAPKPAVMMAMDKGLTYRQIMRKADTMTAVLSSVLVALLAKAILLIVD